MAQLPINKLDADEVKLLQDAGQLLIETQGLKEQPGKLRLKLVDVQVMRFSIGQKKAQYKGFARELMGTKYRENKTTMSNNAAYKEAEMNEEVIAYKNSADLFETAYDVMDGFVTSNQTSLRLASEEAKNNL